uniref:Uncharacterized protein n=1 Tax=Trypanosoma congolense (strain IL3000) TaxID=1068625 RepID=G0UXL3_TRYCI|nr:conserved hypothetical protein [Trypanosoma congolense IL3000]
MRRSLLLQFTHTPFHLFCSTFPLLQCGGGGCGFSSGSGGFPTDADALAKILSQTQSRTSGGGSPDFFDGNFVGGSRTMDPAMLRDMHQKLSQSLTPDMRESMRAMVDSMQRGDGMPQMGMMAFGVGENEKGKKVARGAKMMFDPKTGKFSKDFVEQQLEDDDLMLPKETVEDYSTDGAIEVEFEDDTKQSTAAVNCVQEAEVIAEDTKLKE